MTSCLVFYEGVMRDDRDRPIMEGIWLVRTLAAENRVIIATEQSRELVEHELRNEQLLAQVVDVLDRHLGLPPIPLWQRQIEVARNRGPVVWMLAGDPQIIEWGVSHGMVSLFFAHPRQGGPARRPETSNRSWSSLLDELEVRP